MVRNVYRKLNYDQLHTNKALRIFFKSKNNNTNSAYGPFSGQGAIIECSAYM